MTFFGSTPIGYNHPKMKDPEFLRVLLAGGAAQAVRWPTSTPSSTPGSWTPSRASPCPPHLQYAFFVEGGALGVENALKAAFDWKVRRNRAQRRDRGAGHADPPLPRGLPRPQRLHALAHQHRPTQDRLLSQVPLAARRQPEAALPGHPGGRAGRGGRRAAALDQITQGLRGQSRRHRRHHHRAHPGRGGRQPLPRRVPAGPGADRRRERVLLHRGRGADGDRPHRARCGPTSTSGSRPDAVAFGKKMQVVRLPGAGPRWTRSRRTSSRCPRASTRPGAAASPTWCASARFLEIIEEDRLVDNARDGRRAPAARPARPCSTSWAAS